MVHERIRQEMRHILEEDTELTFLDARAQGLLREAREFLSEFAFERTHDPEGQRSLLILPWAGDLAQNALYCCYARWTRDGLERWARGQVRGLEPGPVDRRLLGYCEFECRGSS